ncbi:MAG: hypothetical protein ACI88H_000047 [Cocleimonas sp.]|jgi:hypothetical protein
MKSDIIDLKRRNILKQSLCGLSAVAAASILAPQLAVAESELPKLTEDDPMAMGLGYKNDATTVDTTKYPKRAGDAGAKQWCDNCSLYTGDKDAEWGKCSIFGGKQINAKGWCNAWVAKD